MYDFAVVWSGLSVCVIYVYVCRCKLFILLNNFLSMELLDHIVSISLMVGYITLKPLFKVKMLFNTLTRNTPKVVVVPHPSPHLTSSRIFFLRRRWRYYFDKNAIGVVFCLQRIMPEYTSHRCYYCDVSCILLTKGMWARQVHYEVTLLPC